MDHLQVCGIIAIIRGDLGGRELDLAAALIEGGITAIEVSAVSAGYVEVIRRMTNRFGDRASFGGGTILNLEQLQSIHQAGASFVVSPNMDEQIIRSTKDLRMASFAGAYTATEVVAAVNCGADAVKLFPAVSLGPSYVRALRAPFPDIKFVPTGGVNVENLAEFFEAGAWAIGAGSEFVGRKELHDSDFDGLKEKALAFSTIARGARHVR
jgi:2-dehydro-3-deoxyphosphogluconate aldolase/(4S)-4-hydroxy-2-oxoglutarate aldolase